jgi:hypothetical protein
VHLDRQVESLGLHRGEEGRDPPGGCGPLGQPRVARELPEAVQVAGVPRDERPGPGQADQDDFRRRQGGPQRPQRRHGAEQVAQLQGPQHGNPAWWRISQSVLDVRSVIHRQRSHPPPHRPGVPACPRARRSCGPVRSPRWPAPRPPHGGRPEVEVVPSSRTRCPDATAPAMPRPELFTVPGELMRSRFGMATSEQFSCQHRREDNPRGDAPGSPFPPGIDAFGRDTRMSRGHLRPPRTGPTDADATGAGPGQGPASWGGASGESRNNTQKTARRSPPGRGRRAAGRPIDSSDASGRMGPTSVPATRRGPGRDRAAAPTGLGIPLRIGLSVARRSAASAGGAAGGRSRRGRGPVPGRGGPGSGFMAVSRPGDEGTPSCRASGRS